MPITFIKVGSDNPITLIAEKLEPKLRAAFLRAVKSLKDSVSLDALVEAIKTNDANQAMTILAIDQKFVNALNGVGQDAGVQSFRSAIQSVFAAGAATAEEELPASIGAELSFNLMNPETVSFLEQYTFPLIRQISANTRESLRGVLIDAFKHGGHPFDQARRIKTFIGLTDTQSKAVLNYENALSNSDTLSQSLNRSLRDGRFDPTIRRAMRMNRGLSQDQIDKMTQRYSEKYIQYRAQTIARTETLRASNLGQRALWKQVQSQGLLDKETKRRWIVSGDSATCDECMDLNGEVTGIDEPFSDGTMDPPQHPSCRCGQGLVFGKN
jgi:SPP1 gp7 family putative phage head morphogenesis protein